MVPVFCIVVVKVRFLFCCSLPDSIGDDLIVEVRDSKGKFCGRVLAQLAAIVEEPVRYMLIHLCCCVYKMNCSNNLKGWLFYQSEKLKWWAIYHEPEHERIGRIQLHINYLSSLDEKTKVHDFFSSFFQPSELLRY